MRQSTVQNTDIDEGVRLLKLIAGGDRHALSRLYDHYANTTYSLALRIVGRTVDAEEVVSELFLRVWNRAESYEPSRASVAGWLFMITRRLAIDKTRSRAYLAHKREQDLVSISEDTVYAIDDNPFEAIDCVRQNTHLHAEIRKMTQDHRTVLHLSYFEDLSHAEIARTLGLPLGTVKTRLRTAVARLRESLANQGGSKS